MTALGVNEVLSDHVRDCADCHRYNMRYNIFSANMRVTSLIRLPDVVNNKESLIPSKHVFNALHDISVGFEEQAASR